FRARVEAIERRLREDEPQHRAMMHIISDLNEANHRLANHRKAMLHILADYEHDRKCLVHQSGWLDNSRRALLNILKDSHQDRLHLEASRKAMIHIMGDLRDTMAEVERRERELREKQQQLVQAGKLATLGELTAGIAHELNNPLNNIGLFVSNAEDLIRLRNAMQEVRKATEIISHLRMFGRAAPASRELVSVRQVILRALSLINEQLRLREIEVVVALGPEDPVVMGNSIQLEQVVINLLTNARDAMADSPRKVIRISGSVSSEAVEVVFSDTGHGIAPEFVSRIFDPFFTTKEVGEGTGLGLSITYGIINDHGGSIKVTSRVGEGTTFVIRLPRAATLGTEEASAA
ncbi:MAG: two-component sensor histidine kinase, partial [Acidobacteria bacterium]